MTKRNPGEYPVGYAKPPAASRFKQGRSGNPTGRPKGRRTLTAALQHVLGARVTVTEHGRRLRKSKLEIALTQLANKAASGDLKATGLLLQLLPLLDPAGASALGLPDLATDHAVAARAIARIAADLLAPTSPTATLETSSDTD